MLRHFIELDDFSKDELLHMLDLFRFLKEADRKGVTPRLLRGMTLGMLFESASLRTRVSFETAMMELGGHAIYLKPGEIHLGVRESIYDTIQVLSRMCDGIMVRAHLLETMHEIVDCATVPVINGMTTYSHPTQGLCDFFTMTEHLPKGKTLEEMKVAFVSDASHVGCICTSLREILPIFGSHLVVAAPEPFQVEPQEVVKTKAACQATGAIFEMTDDPIEAVRDADFIVTDVWWYEGYDDQKDARLQIFMPKYQINRNLLNHAPAHCKVLHCMPANRDYEITSEVMDSPSSVVFEEAENRFHTQKALLLWFLYPNRPNPSPALQQYYEGATEAFLQEHIPSIKA
jgi:putrescine carbamoyltransferase